MHSHKHAIDYLYPKVRPKYPSARTKEIERLLTDVWLLVNEYEVEHERMSKKLDGLMRSIETELEASRNEDIG